MEENLVWKLISYIFQLYESYEIKLASKFSSFTVRRSALHAGLYLDILDADRLPNAVRVHGGTTQVDFEVDRPPPADSSPGDLLITMVKETVIIYIKKKEFQKMKKLKLVRISLIDLKVMKTRLSARLPVTVSRACKRGFRPAERNFRQDTHRYPQADICSAPYSDHDDTHTPDNRL